MPFLGVLQSLTAQPCAEALLCPVSSSKDQHESVCPGRQSASLGALVEPRTQGADLFLVSSLPFSDR